MTIARLVELWEGDLELAQEHRALLTNIQTHSSAEFPDRPARFSAVTLEDAQLLSPLQQPAVPAPAQPVQEVKTKKTLDEKQPIESTQQFLQWFSAIEQDMEAEQEQRYRTRLDQIEFYRSTLQNLLQNARSIQDLVGDLRTRYEFVESKSKSLQEACERLLEERVQTVKMADCIADKLAYFNELERISKLFNAPEDVTKDELFVPMLYKLDGCIDFVTTNIKYKDSELYLMRFRQCLTRGLSLIKLRFVEAMQEITVELVPKSVELQRMDEVTTSALTSALYVKFSVIAPQLRELVKEIDSRCTNHPEYESLLRDCFNAFFSSRQQLFGPLVEKQVKKLATQHGDVLELMRNGCAYIVQACRDEYKLFYEFFEYGFDDLTGYLETIASYLNDHLRPMILREAHIDTLSELCATIQGISMTEDEDETAAMEVILSKIRQDAQSRLVFRTQTYIRESIQNFHPAAADLEFPKAAKLANGKSEEKGPQPVGEEGLYFPTVSRSLYIMSKLYENVQDSVFEDLSQDVLTYCIKSILQAARQIESMKGKQDSLLFIVANLVALREQTAPFDSNFVYTDAQLDFSVLQASVAKVVQSGVAAVTSVPSSSWFDVVSYTMPKLIEQRLDAKQQLDSELKKASEAIILDTAKASLEPFVSFVVKASSFKTHGTKMGRLREQNYALPHLVKEMYDAFIKTLKSRLKPALAHMYAYTTDEAGRAFLRDPILEQIGGGYQRFLGVVKGEYDEAFYSGFMTHESLRGVLSEISEEADASQTSPK